MIYIVQAYEFETDKGRLKNSALIELIDTSAENAIERTKKIISKKFYRISNVIEKQI